MANTSQLFNTLVLTLTRLGLTPVQARVYVALSQMGTSKVKPVSRVSGVARQDIYRIMSVLQELGLVEKIIAAPTVFRAIAIKDAFSILLERRTKEASELQAEIEEFLKSFRKIEAIAMDPQEEIRFSLIPKEDALVLRVKQAVMTAQRSVDIATTWKKLPQTLLILAEELRKAIKRGVKIRFIAEKPEYENSWPEIVQAFKRNPSFKLRSVPNPPNTVFGIYDEEVFIVTSTAGYAAEYPALWSNNPALVSAMRDLFDIMWFTSVEDKHEPN